MNRELPVVLVTGGLYDGHTPGHGWDGPGVSAALRALGWPVHTPRRAHQPRSWGDETSALAAAAQEAGGGDPVALVAASNGCSAALRVAVDHPELVDRLVLCWPATGDDAEVDRRERRRLEAGGADDAVVTTLLDGELVRGLRPDELRSVDVTVVLVPAEPDDDDHQRRTVAELRRLLPRAVIGLGTPTPRHPSFGHHLAPLVALLDVVLLD